jgi:methyl-accepting chemotaxis protein
MSRMSFHQKLWLLVVVVWLALAVMGALSAWEIRRVMLDDRKALLDAVLDAGNHVIDVYKAKVDAREMSLVDAQKAAIVELGRITCGTDGYIFAATLEPVMLLNHARPQMEGKYAGKMKDSQGNLIFPPIFEAVRSGHGYVRTNTPKPGEKTDSAKISAVKKVDGWNWVIGTGAYIDDIDGAVVRALFYKVLEVLAAGGFASLLAALLIRNLSWSRSSASSGVRSPSKPFGIVKNCRLLQPGRSPRRFVTLPSVLRSMRPVR